MKSVYEFNSPQLKPLRQVLRQNQTSQEKMVWSKLRNKQVFGLKFYRQYSVGIFILDFYCPTKKLAIEIDGGQHNQVVNQERDAVRSEYLQQRGIKILRFWNNEVTRNLDGVLEKIKEELVS